VQVANADRQVAHQIEDKPVAVDQPTISTHILDTGAGVPRAGATVRLWRLDPGDGPATMLGESVTDADGRVRDLLAGGALEAASYALEFAIDDGGFFQALTVQLRVADAGRGYHVPLLLAPFGLTTYRGS
jgi:hydroxyisourate hydrolase